MQPDQADNTKPSRSRRAPVIFGALIAITSLVVLGEFLANAQIMSRRMEDFTEYLAGLSLVFILFYLIRVSVTDVRIKRIVYLASVLALIGVSLNVLNDIERFADVPLIGANSALNTPLKNASTTVSLMLVIMSMVLSVISLRNARDQLLREREVLKAEVHERRQIEKALQESEEKYKTFFKNSCDPMQLLQDGKILECNTATLQLLGFEDKEDVLTLSPWELSTVRQPNGGGSHAQWTKIVGYVREHGTHLFEWDLMGRDGHTVPVEVSLTLLPSERGIKVLSVWRDISDRRHSEQERAKLEYQLRQSQKMDAVGQLAGGVAHDFNNLLQGIRGYSELAQMEVEPEGHLHEMLEQVLGATNRAGSLITQLLAFSRRQVLKLEVVDIGEVVEELAKMIRRLIGEHIALSIVSDPGTKLIHADRGQMEQILMNLCVNSRDAMTEEGGKITIEVRTTRLGDDRRNFDAHVEPGSYVQLAVSDTGCGMTEDTKQRVFEPFFTTKGKGKGTGLGLSTVYGIVSQHHGTIDIRSKTGQGTTFSVYIPQTDFDLQPYSDSEKSDPEGGSEVILLAEDDDIVRELGQELLNGAGYTVYAVADGEQAIQAFEERKDEIRLVLLDVVMPGCGGRAVYDHIQESGTGTPVLFASGYSASEIHTHFVLEEGMNLIQKPYGNAELLGKVRQMLDS